MKELGSKKMTFSFRKGKSGVMKTLQGVMQRVSNFDEHMKSWKMAYKISINVVRTMNTFFAHIFRCQQRELMNL